MMIATAARYAVKAYDVLRQSLVDETHNRHLPSLAILYVAARVVWKEDRNGNALP